MLEKKRIAEIYHQETKYSEQDMLKHQKRIDFRTQPSPYKEYHSDKKIDLVSYLPFQNNPFTGKAMDPAAETERDIPFSRAALSRLLYFTNGVTGILKYPNGQTLTLRAAPTAGGLYPTEIYLAVRNCSFMESGIYNFQVKDHSLILVLEGDYWAEFQKYSMDHEAIGQSNLLMIFTAVYQRSAWRYSERAYRRILLDTGHLLGNLTAYANEEGFTPYPIGGFFDASLNTLLFLDKAKEGVLITVALPQTDRFDPTKIRIRSAVSSRTSTRGVTDSDMLQLQLHRASSIIEGDKVERWPSLPELVPRADLISREKGVNLPRVPLNWPGGVGQTILVRRSTRAYTGEGFLQEELGAILDYTYAPVFASPSLFFNPSLLSTYIVAQKVLGLPEGVYLYDPEKKTVASRATGDFRNQTGHFCLGQELAKNAAALVIHVAHFKTALGQYGDRAYRYLHLDAGHLGERMNLVAIQMGLGVSGIGGFYDDEVNNLLHLSLDWIVVYVTTLGRP